MSAFLPARASPRHSSRPRQNARIPNLSSMDITTTSATSSVSAALSGLPPKDVELIDEIIERSPPSATTFLTVFKAYNEVLQERGMDAANDVVYYKILLKLGVVKGKDWGAKWRTVKEQQGYGNVREEDVTPLSSPRARGGTHRDHAHAHDALTLMHQHRAGISRAPYSRLSLPAYARDTVTVHSHQDDDSEALETETGAETGMETESGIDRTTEQATDDPDVSSPPTTLVHREKANDTKENALGLSTDLSSYPPLPTVDQFLPVQAKKLRSIYHGSSEISSDIITRTSSPPPTRRVTTRRPLQPIRQLNAPPASHLRPLKPALKPPPQNDSINEEDAWKKVKMIRDEKEADRFREVMLLERCWEVWKGSLRWMNTMNEKVDGERDKTLLHEHLEKWRLRYRKKQDEYRQIGRLHDVHLLRILFAKWKMRVQTVQVTKWKEDMRRRMSLIRARRDERIREEAWKKWQQARQAEAAFSFYERNLLRRTVRRWTARSATIGRLEGIADGFAQSLEDAQRSLAWEFWKIQTDLRGLERAICARVDERRKEEALRAWKQKMSMHRKADAFHDRLIMKHYYRAWNRSLSKQQAMVRKADKYKSRQDGILLLAVFRMWIAQERGMLMDRATNTRLLNSVWSTWKARLADVRGAEERAMGFCNRPSSALVGAAFARWRETLLARQNLMAQAQQYDQDVLMHRTLLVWRVQLRVKLKMAKHSKVARKYLLLRSAWCKWKEMAEEKKRERLLQLLHLKLLRKYYERWHSIYVREQYNKLALKQFRVVVSTRILEDSLSKWTNRVIVIKLRELEVVEKRDKKSISSCYDKWKIAFKRHADELRLMQSYQYVKREELLRRMFSKWYSAAKANRHRKLLLQEREEEMKLEMLEKTWDQWRERYKAEQLRPLEMRFVIQCQKSCLYRTYLLWHSKTKSIPAIQFFSLRAKSKYWRIWREAMPKALQAREARNWERQKVLARALDKWTQAYRTKIALKAVARARYLRLPSGMPRQSIPLSSALSGVLRSTPSTTSGKATRPSSPTVDGRYSERPISVQEDASASRAGSTGAPRRRFSALRATKLSVARPTYGSRDAPAERKTDLWHELRRIQRGPMSDAG